jgi:uncharacterized protein YjdB
MKRIFGVIMAIIMVISIIPNSFFKASASAVAEGTYVTGDIMTYGSYPQTKVTSPSLISALNAQKLQADNTVTYGGSKYLRVYFTQYSPYEYGDPATKDNSYQDENGYLINTVYWFKYEPIQWRVLSSTSGELFVMAEKILASRAYNQIQTDVSWESCDLRNWLNNGFYSTAFSSAEKARIETSTVVNENNPENGTNGGNNTSDKLFLLSYSEATNTAYGFSSDTGRDTSRQVQGTDYSKSQGLYVYAGPYTSYTGNSFWWLRTPGNAKSSACVLYYDGNIYGNGLSVFDTDYGIRPALKINLSAVLTSSVTLSKTSASLSKGKALQLSATVLPLNATNKAVVWTTSSSSVAAVSTTGLVTAKAIGKATITCTAGDGSGIKATCAITVVPPVPANVKAVKASATSIKVSWSAVSGATGYYIYRAAGSGAYSKIKTIAGSSFINASLAKSKTYHYKVQAYKLIGSTLYVSASSAIASATL